MSCFCSPLSTRSLGTRQHLSALCSLFHVTDVKKDLDGFPWWRRGRGCSWRSGFVSRQGSDLSHFSRSGSRLFGRMAGPGRKVHQRFFLACSEISSSHTLHYGGSPSACVLPGDETKNLKLAYTFKISVIK